ncbi:MAG TPA: trypsin-like serine protease [Candidatus Limnocylindrales bacterium]|nr:trypsin-like serine protease [Candidatus Limnocylindrales bacterium]
MRAMKPASIFGLLLVSLMVGFSPALAAPASGSAAQVKAEKDDPQTPEDRAREFRLTFGLDAREATIALAASSSEYDRDPYGVPLSMEERLELGRRAKVERAAEPAADFGAEQATWGGYYIDQLARGTPVFLFTEDIDAMSEAISRILPGGTEFRVERVGQTLASLENVKESIVDAYPRLKESGIYVTGVGLDLVTNHVVVEIDGLDDQSAGVISKEFGQAIEFRNNVAAEADSCPLSGCRQIKGGIRIVGPAGSNYACTSGFIVRRTLDDSLAVLTAGHCLWVQTTTPFGDAWYHDTTSGTHDTFGHARYHGFHDMSYGDVGLIEIDPSESVYTNSTINKIYTDRNGGSLSLVTGVVYDSYQTQGSQACAYGAFSNDYYCTIVNDIDETKVSTATPAWGSTVNYLIQDTKVYGYNLIPGDSGGPIFRIDDPIAGTVLMLGTHVHSKTGNSNPAVEASSGWYTPWNWGRQSYYQASGYIDDYVVCVTATC